MWRMYCTSIIKHLTEIIKQVNNMTREDFEKRMAALEDKEIAVRQEMKNYKENTLPTILSIQMTSVLMETERCVGSIVYVS